MSVSLKSKLSYAWSQMTKGGVLYGRVHSGNEKVDILHRGLADCILFDRSPLQEGYVNVKKTQWLEAHPKNDGHYELWHAERYDGKKADFRDVGTYTREQLVSVVNRMEQGWRRHGSSEDSHQPFAGSQIEKRNVSESFVSQHVGNIKVGP